MPTSRSKRDRAHTALVYSDMRQRNRLIESILEGDGVRWGRATLVPMVKARELLMLHALVKGIVVRKFLTKQRGRGVRVTKMRMAPRQVCRRRGTPRVRRDVF